MASLPVIRANAIGATADQHLVESGQGVVVGLTSRGAFLRLEPVGHGNLEQAPFRTLFLSHEPFRGPLTINWQPGIQFLAQGDSFTIRSGRLLFSRLGRHLCIHDAPLWSAPPRPASLLPRQERQALFERISRRISSARALPEWALALLSGGASRNRSVSGGEDLADHGMSGQSAAPALPLQIASLSRTPFEPPHNGTPLSCYCEALIAEAFSSSGEKTAPLAEYLVSCLGRGPGLTPAGDDLVLGFLLALSRWGDVLCPELPAAEIAPLLVQAAHKKTTSLSAQLIECAAQGQADERLIAALDGLISGQPDEDSIVRSLLDWGHTSGAATLQGMYLLGG